MPFRMGPTELIIILVIVMIIFGVGRLPQIGGALGKGIREFRRGQSGDEDESSERDSERKGETSAPPREAESPPTRTHR